MKPLKKIKKPDSITVIASINIVMGIAMLVFSFIFKNINRIFFEANEASFNELLFSVFPVLNIWINNQNALLLMMSVFSFFHIFGGIFFINGSNFGRRVIYYLNWIEYLLLVIIVTVILQTTYMPNLTENDKNFELLMQFYKSYAISISSLILLAYLIILYFIDKKAVKDYCEIN